MAARVGPGGDNVTGDRYTLDLGVEPDLGNLLQNLEVANDYLDQAEQRFRTISEVVGTTTQRLAAATRQTQLLAAETQRLQNSYAAIASSSMGMANMGMMGGGMMMGGGYMPQYAGQMSFGGMSQTGNQGNVIQTMPSIVEDQNAGGGYMGGQSTVGPPRMPSMRMTNIEQGKEFFFGQNGKGGLINKVFPGGSRFGSAIDKFRKGYNLAGAASKAGSAGQAAAGATQTAGAAGQAAGAAEELGALGSAGAFAANAVPYVAAAAAAAKVVETGYKVWAGAQAESRRVAGMTGGEAGMAGMFGNNAIPGSLALNARARWMGLLNPGVDYGEIQDRTLSAGYVEGKGYEEARNYLFETYKRGLGTTIDQMDLYREAVDKGGASTQQLVSGMDALRDTASNTNASIGALMNNMKSQVEDLTAMGFSGGAAVSQATQGAQAFAQDKYATLNPNLREAGGYSMSGSPYMASQIAGNLNGGQGVSYGQIGAFIYSHPGVNMNVQGETVARNTLMQKLGFKEGASALELSNYAGSRGWTAPSPSGSGYVIGDILSQLGILPQNLSGADYKTVLNWIWVTINRQPMHAQADAAEDAMKGKSLTPGPSVLEGSVSGWTQGSAAGMKQGYDIMSTGGIPGVSRVLGGLGGAAGSIGGALGGLFGGYEHSIKGPAQQYVESLGLSADNPLGNQLLQTFGKEGAKTSPVLEKILAGEGTPENTYVKTQDGRVIRMDDWIKTAPDWQNALATGRVQIAHASEETQEALGGKTRGIENDQVVASGNLEFNTAEQEMTNVGERINGTMGRRTSENVMGLDERSIIRMADEIGKSVANNI